MTPIDIRPSALCYTGTTRVWVQIFASLRRAVSESRLSQRDVNATPEYLVDIGLIVQLSRLVCVTLFQIAWEVPKSVPERNRGSGKGRYPSRRRVRCQFFCVFNQLQYNNFTTSCQFFNRLFYIYLVLSTDLLYR